jgi:hypothetical protein
MVELNHCLIYPEALCVVFATSMEGKPLHCEIMSFASVEYWLFPMLEARRPMS